MESILEASSRTVSKIIKRMQLACFECGWDKCVGDLHHILPQSKGGSDYHDNLTYLCPNCHRMAHNDLIVKFKNLHDVIGETWKDFYNVSPLKHRKRTFTGKRVQNKSEALKLAREQRSKNAKLKAEESILKFRNANIDCTKYGWIQLAAPILGISHSKVKGYIKKYAPDLLVGAKLRTQNYSIKEK